ncbi:MAG: hypothetical protein ACOY30_03760 [Bacillota bacterium]
MNFFTARTRKASIKSWLSNCFISSDCINSTGNLYIPCIISTPLEIIFANPKKGDEAMAKVNKNASRAPQRERVAKRKKPERKGEP